MSSVRTAVNLNSSFKFSLSCHHLIVISQWPSRSESSNVSTPGVGFVKFVMGRATTEAPSTKNRMAFKNNIFTNEHE